VNHKSHNTLDNRESNLDVTTNQINCSDRLKANKNNKTTGIRNVNYIRSEDVYKVQICKNYVRYYWTFPVSQFDEACEFARQKRIEFFGKE
jgi:hypothetical protein